MDCRDGVNAIDALLVLQYDVGLIDSIFCLENGDVGQDGSVDALDAFLILQFDAGLLDASMTPVGQGWASRFRLPFL